MARILIISGDHSEGRNLARLLRRDGHATDLATTDARAVRALVPGKPELLLLSLPDPADTLYALSRKVGAGLRRIPAMAIVKEDRQSEIDREAPGLLDVLPTPFTEEVFLTRVDALLRVRDVLFGGSSRKARALGAEPVADPAARNSGILQKLMLRLDRYLHAPVRRRKRPIEPYLDTAASIVGAIEGRDSLDPGHGMRVSGHCESIAATMGLGREETATLLYAASVHDIGKVTISAELFAKPTLDESDRRLMRLHARRGAELIRALTPHSEAAELVLHHHEHPDGTGYYGAKGDEIPLAARILSVAEVFDAMTSSRSERRALTPEEAVDKLYDESGTAYDADCVEALSASVRPRRTSLPLSQIPLLPVR